MKTLYGHLGAIEYIVFSFDGKFILSRSNISCIKIWDLESGLCIKTIEGHVMIHVR